MFASRDSWPFHLPADNPDGNPHPVESTCRKPYYINIFDNNVSAADPPSRHPEPAIPDRRRRNSCLEGPVSRNFKQRYIHDEICFTEAILSDLAVQETGSSRAAMHMVAKLYYLSNIPQNEIARQLSLSTATVSRLLKRAREEGIVRIEVRDLVGPDELARDLEQRLGLKRAVVADVPEANAVTALAGAASACFVEAGLKAGSVVAIGWGRAVRDIVQAGLPRIPGVITVPANGGMQETAEHFQINEFVRLAAEQMGGAPRFLHAPYLPSAALREAFLADPSSRETVTLWDRVEIALVGIGLPHMSPTPGQLGVTADERLLTTAAGDVIRHYFDIHGQLVPWAGADRLIALSVAQLRAIPWSIGVAVSSAKAGAIVGAVRARLVNVLVTDVRTAQAVLDACE